MHMGGGGGGGMGHGGGGGHGHSGSGGGHSSFQHDSSSSHTGHHQGGVNISQILGLNNHSGGIGGILSHLFGQHHSATGHGATNHHHTGGEPDQAINWNMAWQSEKGVFFKFLQQKIRLTPTTTFIMMFMGFIVWLGVIYEVRHHDPNEHFSRLSEQLYGQQVPVASSVPPQQAQDATSLPYQNQGFGNPSVSSPAYISQPQYDPAAVAASQAPSPFAASAAAAAAATQPQMLAPSQFGSSQQGYATSTGALTGSYAGVPRGFAVQPRTRMVVSH